MFYKNTNLLPRHSGVFFAIVILLILLVLNFDKCYSSLTNIVSNWITTNKAKNNNIEHFEDVTKQNTEDTDGNNIAIANKLISSSSNNVPTVKKISVQINPEKQSITAKFEHLTSAIPTGYILKNYLLVLAKYNKDLEQVDSLNVKLSDELSSNTTTTKNTANEPLTEPTLTTETDITKATQQSQNGLGQSICNNEGICSYTFTDLETKDDTGNSYYYKLGVGVVYDNNKGTDIYSNITTYSFGTGNNQQYFRVDIDMQEQEKLLRRLSEIESASLYSVNEQKPNATNIEETISQGHDIDAYMKMLRPYIGNYPDEFTLDKQKIKELTLDSYLDEKYAVGEFNVNVNLGNIMPAPTVTSVL